MAAHGWVHGPGWGWHAAWGNGGSGGACRRRGSGLDQLRPGRRAEARLEARIGPGSLPGHFRHTHLSLRLPADGVSGWRDSGAILGGQKIASSTQAKILLYQRNHPAAIDLESGSVAQIAKDKNLPFAVLRAVADPAERNLPPAALVALREDGSLDIIRLMQSIARQPWQIPGLVAVGRDAKAARRALLERLKTLPASP